MSPATLDTLDLDIGLEGSLDIPLDDAKEKKERPIESAAWAALGPPGSGKTALLVYFAYWYHQQGIPVFCNLRSTQAWTRPISEIEDIEETKASISHLIVLMTEMQNFAHARRAMSRRNLKYGDKFAQMRKLRSMFLYDTQFWGQVDSNLRPLTQRAFVCWTPDYARHVGAVIYDLAVGHLAPWIRSQMRGQIRMFNTSGIRDLYDTHELTAVEEENQGNVATAQGITSGKPFVAASVKRLAGRGLRDVTAEDVRRDLEEYIGMTLTESGISQHLRALGIPREIEPINGHNKWVYHLMGLTEDEG